MLNYTLQFTVKKILVSALLLTTISDVIKGFSIDIFAPIINTILPGDIKTPISIGKTNLFITRFIIRLINLFFAVLIVQFINNSNFT